MAAVITFADVRGNLRNVTPTDLSSFQEALCLDFLLALPHLGLTLDNLIPATSKVTYIILFIWFSLVDGYWKQQRKLI